MKILVVVIGCLAILFLQNSPSYAIDKDEQLWTLVTATGNITEDKKFRFFVEVQPRLANQASRLERLILHGAVGYKVFDGAYFWLAYGWMPTFIDASYISNFNHENRFWQQLSIEKRYEGFTLNHRLRLEQRIIENRPETGHRLRYSLRGSLPVFNYGSQVIGMTAFNEIFFNLNSTTPGPVAGFGQNRIFIGPYLTDKNVRYEIGILNEYAVRRDNEDRMIHAMLVGVNFNF